MKINALDHLVLTVADSERSASFYETVLGMQRQVGPDGKMALLFGSQKINLHQAGAEFHPHALRPVPGSADLCLLVSETSAEVCAELARHRITLVAGPVSRTGAAGPLNSVYIRDPDGNLIELGSC